jgi:hypothetical protein
MYAKMTKHFKERRTFILMICSLPFGNTCVFCVFCLFFFGGGGGCFLLFCFFVGRCCSSFYFLCCPIMCLYVPSSVLCCLLPFPHKMMLDLWEGACLIYIIYMFLCVWYPTQLCCVLFCLSSSCMPKTIQSIGNIGYTRWRKTKQKQFRELAT